MAKKIKLARGRKATAKDVVQTEHSETGRYVESRYAVRGVRDSHPPYQGSVVVKTNVKAAGKEDVDVVLVISAGPESKMTSFEKMDLIEQGIPKKALENLKEKAELDYDQLAKVLNVARATLISKKGNEKFSKDVSDKILGLAAIYSYGYEVFEDRDRFNQWVFRANKALGGQAPFDILHNTFGREEVKNLIGRIDYGVYS